MKPDRVIELFKQAGALIEGHFIYASGRHGRHFFQAARVLQYPRITEELCKALADKFAADKVDLVIGPATGGIVLAYETARHLQCRAAFTEKEDGGARMALKRGFRLDPGARVVVVEDIVTTGGSVKKSIDHLRGRGAEIVGVGVLIDRSGGEAKFDSRYEPLARFTLESWPPDSCTLCKSGQPLIDPDNLLA
ncbi:MAG: orotate phosphoribosyltransferase [Candidatus Hydrogenedentes bacterium]|nr:orotate phosphoribosyltransferase [Candidatus Hydrogenedentota bacterium]